MKIDYNIDDLLREFWRLTIYSFAKIIPKQTNIWVFGAWKGEKYCDNSKYLFDYINVYHHEIHALWVTNNRLAYELVRQKGYPVAYSTSWRAIWACMRAGIAISCVDSNLDLPGYAISNRTKRIQLWHGLGPKAYNLKNMSERNKNAVAQMNIKSRCINKLVLIYSYILNGKWDNGISWLPYKLMSNQDLVVTTSKIGVEKMKQVFGEHASRIEILGYPRHDSVIKANHKQNHSGKRVKVLYAPTHRSESQGDVIKHVAQLKGALRLYPEVDFVIKLHDLTDTNEGAGLHTLSEQEIDQDVCNILPSIDVLITDYSSIYTDFLLLDRPIIFTPFDLMDYRDKDQGFFVSYDLVTPGPKASSWEEAIKLATTHRKWSKKYQKARERVLQMFHEARDGKSCERITNRLFELVDKSQDRVPG